MVIIVDCVWQWLNRIEIFCALVNVCWTSFMCAIDIRWKIVIWGISCILYYICIHFFDIDIPSHSLYKIAIYRSQYGRWQRGGNASNICTVLTQLDIKCEFIGSLPNTKMFQFVIDDAVDRGIRMGQCAVHDNYQAPVSTVILNRSTGSRTIVFSSANLPIFTFDDFRKIDLEQYKWIHFEVIYTYFITNSVWWFTIRIVRLEIALKRLKWSTPLLNGMLIIRMER